MEDTILRGTIADPEFRTARARKANAASHSLAAKVRYVIKHAGKLTPEQQSQIRASLPPVSANGKQ